MPGTRKLRGLYAITDATLQRPDQLVSNVARAIEGGAKLVQYRDKSGDRVFRLQQASELAELCRGHGIPLIINDDVQLAAECGAQGVHLGSEDQDPVLARQLLGDDAIIGVSCYNQWPLAERAAGLNINYVAFGRFFTSRTKPGAVQASLDLIRQARQQLTIPVTAIGGITPQNGDTLVEAGADLLAVVQGVFASADIRRAAEQYTMLFK